MLSLQTFTFNAFSENTYLLTNPAGDCWIVDPGMQDADELAFFLAHLGANNLRPQAIINTHGHIDHIFGIAPLVEHFRIPFYLHEKELPVLAAAKGAAAMFGMAFGEIPVVDHYLRESEVFMAGEDALELRLVPGHSPGSVVFRHVAGNWLIAGDTLFAGSIGRTDLPGGSHDTLMAAIPRELFSLPDETVVYPGHGPSTTIGTEKRTNPFFTR